MNIKEAKEEIKNSLTAYFTKDKFGNYKIPIEKQRPLFLMGPPGIGKTNIMEQVAEELDVGLISYSMTHHTRQSALGLPFIKQKTYGGREYNVSEYTMSEIIASVYNVIEETGRKEGILFLDEINCVSETLAPSMLQFLQYKIFGVHRVPEGWMVVTAGNPPEYNNSVREFDIVTWDRLKRIDIEPDYTVWKEYAYKAEVHASIISYLDIKKNDFYKIESTVDGKSFVTARGWCDLSDMIKLYEENNIPVKESLVVQYLQNKKVAKEFAIYYDLFKKYRSDYQIDKILDGGADSSIISRAKSAKFDERLAVVELLIDGCTAPLIEVVNAEKVQTMLLNALKAMRFSLAAASASPVDELNKQINKTRNEMEMKKKAGSLSQTEQFNYNSLLEALDEDLSALIKESPKDNNAAFALLKKDLDSRTRKLKKSAENAKQKLSNAFSFLESAFSEGQEILIFVTELTTNWYSSHFITNYGCEEYFSHNKGLLFYDRQKQILKEIDSLNLDVNK